MLYILTSFVFLFSSAGRFTVDLADIKYPINYGRKEMFYLTTHSTHFYLRLYDVGHMIKDYSDSKRRNPLPPYGLLFPINSKGSFICIISHTR